MGMLTGIIALLLLIGCLVLAGGCSGQSSSPPPVVVSAKGIQSLDRAAIRAMLKRLADTAPPTKDTMGASCYGPRPPITRSDYVCPHCSERTLYEENSEKQGMHGIADVVDREIPECRREYIELRKVAHEAVVLDEAQFCRKCSPDVTEPAILLRVIYEDGKPRDIQNIHAEDLRILREFLAGELMHKQTNDGQTSLKHSLSRLQQLLGVELEK